MKTDDHPGDDRWRDRMVGDAQVPLPEPWFIRDLRRPAAGNAAVADDDDGDVLPMVVPRPAPADDLVLGRDRAIDEPEPAAALPPARQRPIWPYLLAAGVAAIVLLASWLASVPRSGGAADVVRTTTRVAPPPVASVAAPAAPSTGLCANPTTLERLRGLVVGDAARRGGDPQDMRAAAAGLSLSVTETADTSGEAGAVQCRGWLTLVRPGDAPVTARVGFRALTDPRGIAHVSILEGTAPIANALAASEAAAVAPPPAYAPPQRETTFEPLPPPAPRSILPTRPTAPVVIRSPAPPPQAAPRFAPPPVAVAPARVPVDEPRRYSNPSFDCSRATSQVNHMICNSDSLAALDRAMSAMFYDLMRDADRDTRADLEEGRRDFLIRKQRCDDEACIADAYRDRIDELRTYR